MCGRYNFSAEESAELREIVRQIEAKNTQGAAVEEILHTVPSMLSRK